MKLGSDARSGVRFLLILAVALLGWRLWAVSHADITLYVDEAQYWTWAQHMDWGFFSKPPGIAALIWLSTALFGDGILGVKALAMLCYPLAAAAGWAVARRLYDARTAFWSALAILTLPMFSWLGLFVSTDALLTLFWMLGLWAWLRARDSDAWGDWLLLGVVCGLGLLSKYTMAAFLGAAFLYLLAFERHRLASTKPWAAALLALLILSPNIAWNIAHDFPTLKHTADITLNRDTGGGLKPLGEFWVAQWAAFGPILGSVFLLILLNAVDSWRDERRRLLLWFALPLWLVVSAQAFKSSANANWAAPAFAPAAIAAIAWLLAGKRQKLVAWAIGLNVLLVSLLYHWPTVLAVAQVSQPAKKSPYSRARGWDELGRQLSPILSAHPDAVLIADNRTLLAHMLYETRAQHPLAASWNPSGQAADHYKLTTSLLPHVGRDMLLITDTAPGDDFASRFAGIEKLARLEAPLDERTSRTMAVYLLHGFKGY